MVCFRFSVEVKPGGSSEGKQQTAETTSLSVSLSSSCSSSSAEEELLVMEESASGQPPPPPPPMFFIKPIDSQGQSIAGKERLEDRGTLLPTRRFLLSTFFLASGLLEAPVANVTDLYCTLLPAVFR